MWQKSQKFGWKRRTKIWTPQGLCVLYDRTAAWTGFLTNYLEFGIKACKRVAYVTQLYNIMHVCKYICQGLGKSESIMGAILALPIYFQRISYICEWILQYQTTVWILSNLVIHFGKNK